MHRRLFVALVTPLAPMACALLAGCSTEPTASGTASVRQQVLATERAFARTMADRDAAGFARFIDVEAVFFTGPTPLRGKAAVVAGWARFFTDAEAPFSWAPDEVEVLDSGQLALSSGPVHDRAGRLVARFSSIWRRGPSGQWRIVFDKGSPVCADAGPPG